MIWNTKAMRDLYYPAPLYFIINSLVAIFYVNTVETTIQDTAEKINNF